MSNKFEKIYNVVDEESLLTLFDSFDHQQKLLIEATRIEKEFIKSLVDSRKKQGITQKELSEKTGLTQQVVSSIETCGRRPTLINLIRYLLGINININKIFEK